MDRARILAVVDVGRTKGLEIGALDRPIVTREMGPVEYIDRASRAELQRWYAINDEFDTDKFVDVDHVWGDETLLGCVGGRREYAWLVASHVIEHVPDLFGWLAEITAVLVDGGLAVFVVPDKRHTFDILRRTSSEAELVDAYVRGLRRPDARQIFDHFHNFRDLGSQEIRGGAAPADVAPTHSPRESMELCRRSHEGGEYIDTHCWVFTPRSLLAALDLGSQLGVAPFEIATLDPTRPGDHEFLVVLRRLPDGLAPDDQRAAFVASSERLQLPPEDLSTAEAQAAIARCRAIEASTSWRITAPLRAAVTLLRRGARRA